MRGVPRLEISELCWLCGKPILPGHATRPLLREGGFVVHARCYEEDADAPPSKSA